MALANRLLANSNCRGLMRVAVQYALAFCAALAVADAQDARQEVIALFEAQQYLEECVLDQVHWEWTFDKGTAATIEEAFDPLRSTDVEPEAYKGELIAEGGVYYYALIAAQEPRVLPAADKASRTAVVTSLSKIYMSNGRSRLLYWPGFPMSGIADNEEHGLNPQWGPSTCAFHGGRIGMNRIKYYLEKLRSGEYEVANEATATLTAVGDEAVVIRLHQNLARSSYETTYSFALRDHLLLGSEHFENGKLSSRSVVTSTITLDNRRGQVRLPAAYTSAVRDGEKWRTRQFTTTKLDTDTSRLRAVAIPIAGERYSMYPYHGESTTRRENATIATLDQAVQELFEAYEKRQQRFKGPPPPVETNYLRRWLVIANLALFGAFAWYMIKRHRTRLC